MTVVFVEGGFQDQPLTRNRRPDRGHGPGSMDVEGAERSNRTSSGSWLCESQPGGRGRGSGVGGRDPALPRSWRSGSSPRGRVRPPLKTRSRRTGGQGGGL